MDSTPAKPVMQANLKSLVTAGKQAVKTTGMARFQDAITGREEARRVFHALLSGLPVPAFGESVAAPADSSLAEMQARPYQALGVELGFIELSINKEAVWTRVEAITQKPGRRVPPEVIYQPLLEEIKRAASRHPQLADVTITPYNVFGKDGAIWVQTPSSVQFDLGKQFWRFADFVRSNVQPALELDQDAIALVGKEALGDGVIAVVTPEAVSMPAGTIDFVQVRALGWRKDGVIARAWKGLVMVHPDAKNVFAWEDGYGLDTPVDKITVHVMAWGSRSKFKSKASHQSAMYSGVDNWWRRYYRIDNLVYSIDNADRRSEDKLITADAPVKALGGFGMIAINSLATKVNVPTGHNRMALPAIAFKYIKELEYIAELDNREGLPGYYAPVELQTYYESCGTTEDGKTVLPTRALERRPSLPNGKCVVAHQLLGFNPFNAYVVNNDSMAGSGLDFDGDAISCYPMPEDGGVLMPYNLYPLWYQQLVDKHSGDQNRKDLEKTTYVSPLMRIAGQWSAATFLGLSDTTASGFLSITAGHSVRHQLLGLESEGLDTVDIVELEKLLPLQYGVDSDALQNFISALRMVPWIQASVDNQKYVIDYPNSFENFPTLDLPQGTTTASHLVRKIMKGNVRADEPDFGDLTDLEDLDVLFESLSPYAKAWKTMDDKQFAIRELHKRLIADSGIRYMDNRMRSVLLVWTRMLDTKLASIRKAIPLDRFGKPKPHSTDFGVVPDMGTPNLPAGVIASAQVLDSNWHAWIEKNRGSDKQKAAAFNMKDGLLDASLALGVNHEIAKVVKNYSLFREFASVEQLKIFFADIPGVRVSEHFPVLVKAKEVTSPSTKHAFMRSYPNVLKEFRAGRVHNLHLNHEEEMVNFVKYKPYEVGSWLTPDGTFAVQLGMFTIFTPARIRKDAIGWASAHLYTDPAFANSLRDLLTQFGEKHRNAVNGFVDSADLQTSLMERMSAALSDKD